MVEEEPKKSEMKYSKNSEKWKQIYITLLLEGITLPSKPSII